MAPPTRPKPEITGPALLSAFIESNSLSLRQAAEGIGVSKTSLIFWLRSDQRPEFPLRKAIAKWTRGAVPADAWTTPDERETVDRVKPFRKRRSPPPKAA